MASAALSDDFGPLFAWQGRGDAYRAWERAFLEHAAAEARGDTRRVHKARERLAEAQRRRLECGA